jgi:hypothetical protein
VPGTNRAAASFEIDLQRPISSRSGRGGPPARPPPPPRWGGAITLAPPRPRRPS